MIRACMFGSHATTIAVTSLLLLAPGSAQAQDVRATVQVQPAGGPAMNMDYWMSADAVRIDISQGQEVSMVWTSGASPTMLMIQHDERRYMEWTEQQLQMMRQMMERMGGAGGAGNDSRVDIDNIRFEPTGETETIGPWSATGIRMIGTGPGLESTIWVASDLDVGLFELFARMGDGLEAMQMPMMGGNRGGAESQLMRYTQMKNAAGLPDGGIVRVNSNDANGATTITLQSIDEGPLGDDPFSPPAGYEKMQMPNFPG
jgi:hypothetical protein